MRATLQKDPFWTGGQKVPWIDLREGRVHGKESGGHKRCSMMMRGRAGFRAALRGVELAERRQRLSEPVEQGYAKQKCSSQFLPLTVSTERDRARSEHARDLNQSQVRKHGNI